MNIKKNTENKNTEVIFDEIENNIDELKVLLNERMEITEQMKNILKDN